MDRAKMAWILGAGFALGVVTTYIATVVKSSLKTSSLSSNGELNRYNTPCWLSGLLKKLRNIRFSSRKTLCTYDTSLNVDASERESLAVSEMYRERRHELKIQVNRLAKERQISQDICSMFHTPELSSISHEDHVSFVNTIKNTVTYKIYDTITETEKFADYMTTAPKKPPRRRPLGHNMIVTADIHKETAGDFTTLLNEECLRGHSTLNEISSKNFMNFQAASKKAMLRKGITSHPMTLTESEVTGHKEIQTENNTWLATVSGKFEMNTGKSNQELSEKRKSHSLFPVSENKNNNAEKISHWNDIFEKNSKLSTVYPHQVCSRDGKYHKINKETIARRFQKLINFRKKNATVGVKMPNNSSSIESSKEDNSTMTVKFTSLPESLSESICGNK